MDFSSTAGGSIDQMVVRGRMDDQGDINIPLKRWLNIDGDENLDVALVKMRNSQIPNLVNDDDRYWFKWELREYVKENRDSVEAVLKGSTELVPETAIPTGYYPSVADVVRYMVNSPPAVHLGDQALTHRQEMILNVSELVHVQSTDKMTRIESKVVKGLQLFPHPLVQAQLMLQVSPSLLELIKRSSGNYRSTKMWIKLYQIHWEMFDNVSSYLNEEPLCHLMLEQVEESRVDERSKPRLYSFLVMKKVQMPHIPRFVPYRATRQGYNEAVVRSLRFYLEDELGKKIVLTGQKRNFTIELLFRRWTDSSSTL